MDGWVDEQVDRGKEGEGGGGRREGGEGAGQADCPDTSSRLLTGPLSVHLTTTTTGTERGISTRNTTVRQETQLPPLRKCQAGAGGAGGCGASCCSPAVAGTRHPARPSRAGAAKRDEGRGLKQSLSGGAGGSPDPPPAAVSVAAPSAVSHRGRAGAGEGPLGEFPAPSRRVKRPRTRSVESAGPQTSELAGARGPSSEPQTPAMERAAFSREMRPATDCADCALPHALRSGHRSPGIKSARGRVGNTGVL